MTSRQTTRDKPLLVYDGECAFCRRAVVVWRRIARERVEDAPLQQAAARFPEIPIESFREASHLRDVDGRWWRGAEAVFRGLAVVPGFGGWLWLYQRLPGFAAVSERVYRWVARHRNALDRFLGFFTPAP